MTTKTKKRPKRKKPKAHPLDAIIQLIPGYDPVATAGEGDWFDYDEAQNRLDFIVECIVHVKGELSGQPYKLEPWERAIVANLFGWKGADGLRRYRECLIYVARKNSKTTLGAAIANCVFHLDKEPGMECYSAAGESQQAGLLFQVGKEMTLRCADLANRVAAQARDMSLKSDIMSVWRYVSAETSSKHGYNTHFVGIDELHVCDRGLIDVFRTSTGARRQPLMLYFTTADFHRPSVCNEMHEYAGKVRDGVIEDRAFLPVIYEASIDDDWTHPDTWAKANPNLGKSKKLADMERLCELAQNMPSFENEFKRLHLNIITEQAERWLRMEDWDACAWGRCDEPETEE